MTLLPKGHLLATTMLCGTMMFASPAFAQDDPPPVTAAEENDGEAIVITGSRIARPNMEANSPIAVIEGERLVANADVTLDTFLNTLPQVNPAGTTTSNNPGNSGQSNIDLRGLGSSRNLVLVDGRRPMYSGTTTAIAVDLNTIPAALIERVDVITGGAGATYGADAVSGVVNLILRDDFEGIDLRATYANTAETDAREFNASVLLGANFADGRGNAVLAFDYSDRQALIKRQREFAAIATSTTTFLPEGLYNVGNNAPTQAAVDAVFARYGVAAGRVAAGSSGLSFNTDGTLFSPGVFNNPNLDAQNFRYPVDLSVNLRLFPDLYSYNFDEVNLLVLPLERRTIMGRMNFEVSPFFEPFAQIGWTRYSSTTALAPTPVPTVTFRNPLDPAFVGANVSTSLVNSGQSVVQFLLVPTTNPFIPQDLRDVLNSRTGDDARITGAGATEPFLLRQRTLGAGARLANFTNEVIQYLGGARGEFAPGWRYEAYFSEGRTLIENRGAGAIDTQRLQALLEDADATINGCTYNPFGRQPLSAACVAFLEVPTRSEIEFNQRIFQAFITGEVAQLPAGPLSVVFGYENRRFDYAVDPGSLAGPVSGPNTVNLASGKNSFSDFFGEVEIPLLRDRPLADELTINLSARHSEFNATNRLNGVESAPSNDWTYGLQLSYAPIRWFRLRGTYQRAVRAPNFTELFAGGNSAPQFFDPCSANSQFRQGNLGRTAAQALAFCGAAQAIPGAGATFATYVQPPGSQLTINFGANPNVRPEKADTFTVGAVFNAPVSSGLLSSLRGSIDYYNIKIADAIVAPDPNSVVAACFNYSGLNTNFDPTTQSCRSLSRSGANLIQVLNPTAGTAGVFQTSNLAEIQTSGIDVQLGLGVPLEWIGEDARISFDLLVNYLIEWKLRDGIAGLPTIDYAGTIGYFGQGLSNGGGATFPRWRGSLSTTVSDGPFSLNLRTRYIHSMVNRAAVQYVGETSFTGVGSTWYFDLTGTWNIENMTFRLGVNNLFNRQPELYAPNFQSGTDPSTYDVIGRRFFASVGLRF